MKIFARVAAGAAVVLSLVLTPIFCFNCENEGGGENGYKFALTAWQIDCFEGGIGSRTEFLRSVADDFQSDDAVVLVKTHTVESARIAVEKGEIPDVLSFGVGADFALRVARVLKTSDDCGGGEVDGNVLALPWCAGGYYLIAKEGDKRLIDEVFDSDKEKIAKGVVVSQNEYTLPVLALKFAQIKGEGLLYLPPSDAYVRFIEKGGLLLGTQRDARRLEKRGVAFVAEPLRGYTDIVQYVAVSTADDEKYSSCVEFVERLRSEEVQSELYRIGMARIDGKSSDKIDFFGYDFKANGKTASPFSSARSLKDAITSLNAENTDLSVDRKVASLLKEIG